MKFAARDGSTARTLAVTAVPGLRRSAPNFGRAAQAPAAPHVGSSEHRGRFVNGHGNGADGTGQGQSGGRPRQQRPSTVAFTKGQEIFSPGKGSNLVYIVRSGCVRLYKTLPDGRSINLGLLGPNTIFAQEDAYDGLATGTTAQALVDSTLSVVETDDLASLIADSPELASAVVTGMTRRLTELQTLVEHLLVRDTSVRLVATLLSLATRFGRPTADGMTAIALPLTHQSLANMIGSNRVTVTRKLLELQEDGVVRSLGRNALAVDPEKLRRYAQTASTAKETE
ncbi:MAG: Crp/Fnr family transcriptional regulator [Chloroflexota bacterium]|nr:Crp/Fnr family transcriptional regulator [Chloroflexota bacterium]